MPLTFANVDLSPLTPAMSDICDRWWVREAPSLWQRPGYNLDRMHHLPIPPEPPTEPTPLNTLVWPSGASRWATFTSLVGGDAAAAIQSAVDVANPSPRTLLIGDGSTTLAIDMYLVGLRPVFVRDDRYELWLVQLVDERFFWWQQSLTYTFNAGDSWGTLLDNLVAATNTGAIPTIPSIPSAYGTPSALRWTNPGKPLPLLIDAAAATVGLRFLRAPDGSCGYVDATTALAADASQFAQNTGDLVMGGRVSVSEVAPSIPANAAVSFWGDSQVIAPVSLASLSLPPYSGSPPITGVANTFAWIAADMRADAPIGDRNLYAAQAATDYYLWKLSVTDATFRGIRDVVCTGLEDRIEWEYQPGRSSRTETEPLQGPTNNVMPWERVLTRIVRANWGDSNLYGDRPPPGYTYAVRLVEQQPASSGSGSSGSGSGSGSGNSCRPWKARILVVANGVVSAGGPMLGFGADEYCLFVDCSCRTPSGGDLGTAVPDPLTPGKWIFTPAACGGTSSGSGSSGSSGSGTGGSFTIYRSDCAGGVIVRYRAVVSFATQSVTPWVFDSFTGCCACGGSGSGSGGSGGSGGTGTGTGGETVTSPCCGDTPIPTQLVATVTDAGALNGSYPMIYRGAGLWSFTQADGAFGSCPQAPGTEEWITLVCDEGLNWAVYTDNLSHGPYIAPSPTCGPLMVVVSGVAFTICGLAASATITITE